MDTDRSCSIVGTNQVLVDIFCHEGDHGCCCLGYSYKCSIQSHVSIDLILLHSLCPETLTASSDIPVTHIIYKVLKNSCCLRDTIVIQMIIHTLNHGVHSGKEPLIHYSKLIIFQSIFGCIESIDICIENEECIGVP